MTAVSPARRTARVADEIYKVLRQLFVAGEVRDPRLQDLTVTAVKVSGDLHDATVYVASSEPVADRKAALKALAKTEGFLRHHLAENLELRVIPHLHFRYDEGPETGARVEALLAAAAVPPADEP